MGEGGSRVGGEGGEEGGAVVDEGRGWGRGGCAYVEIFGGGLSGWGCWGVLSDFCGGRGCAAWM